MGKMRNYSDEILWRLQTGFSSSYHKHYSILMWLREEEGRKLLDNVLGFRYDTYYELCA